LAFAAGGERPFFVRGLRKKGEAGEGRRNARRRTGSEKKGHVLQGTKSPKKGKREEKAGRKSGGTIKAQTDRITIYLP